MSIQNVKDLLGNIDIYLLDHLMRGNYAQTDKILDAGCGPGRNLVYFLQNGYDVYGLDQDPEAINAVKNLANKLAPDLDSDHFVVGKLGEIPFADGVFDHVICNAVLHFAEGEEEFFNMFGDLIRVLRPGGGLFIRMNSDIGIEHLVKPMTGGKYLSPDGSTRFLLTRKILSKLEERFDFKWKDVVKTVNVQDLRCMSTLVLARK